MRAAFEPFRPTTCRSCKAPIRFVLGLEEGRYMPLDLEPVPDGPWAIEETVRGPQLVQAKKVATSLFGEPERYVSHWATCPDAKDWHARTLAENRTRGPGTTPAGGAQ